jgi:23S rRNA pseudouridine2457 synthase
LQRNLALREVWLTKFIDLSNFPQSMPYRYLVFYKPYNVLSQFSEGSTASPKNTQNNQTSSQQTLKDFIPIAGVYPVGRLDKDSEGLMLLTDDGWVQHRFSDPRYAHPRTYWVQIERCPTEEALIQLRQGVLIKGYRTLPCEVDRLGHEPDLPERIPPIRYRKSVPTGWLAITLREGKNRQVRRMTAAIGHPTLRLVRVAIAHLQLGDLQPGEWRDITKEERRQLLRG